MSADSESLEGDVESSTPSEPSEHSEEEPEKKNSLDKLNDQQLIDHVNDREAELRHLRWENKVFIHFLQYNDPSELEGFDKLVSFAQERAWEKKTGMFARLSITTPRGPDSARGSLREAMRESVKSTGRTSERRSVKFESFSSVSSVFEGRGPKINLSQKSDMVLKAMEELQTYLEIFLKKSHRTRRNIKAELEEYIIRERDIRESKESFEFSIIIQSVDPLTQRIPAEKFVRWMEEWSKSAQLNIEKLRLRTASLKIQYRKVSGVLLQRQELGENVHAVDFDQLEIENKHFAEKIELKNIQLLELKRMSAGSSLVLTNNKKEQRRLQDEYNELKGALADKERIIKETRAHCDTIMEQLEKANDKYNSFKRLTMSFKVPDVMEYVHIKRQLNDLRNKLKVWYRRKKIQDITINACLRQMKNITGSSKIDRTWLENLTVDSSICSSDEDSSIE